MVIHFLKKAAPQTASHPCDKWKWNERHI